MSTAVPMTRPARTATVCRKPRAKRVSVKMTRIVKMASERLV